MGYTIAPVTIGLSGVGFFNAYQNSEGFRAPVRLYGSHRVTLAFLDGTLRPTVGIDLAHEGEERWQGEPGLEGSNLRTELFGTAGLAWAFFDPWTLDVAVRGRLATLTDVPTFEIPIIASLGMATSFDLWDASPPPATPSAEPGIRQREEKGVTTFEKE